LKINKQKLYPADLLGIAGLVQKFGKSVKTINDLEPQIRDGLSRVKMLLMDVDGVMTDGMIAYSDLGHESKKFSTRDGLGLFWVKQYGLTTGVISGRQSIATENRCHDVKIDEIHLGTMHKRQILDDIMQRRNLVREDLAYIGDDVIDWQVMQQVGISAAPNDAHEEILKRVDIILDFPGGRGAVRHFLDLWLQATGQWDKALEDIFHGNF
jgi:3-deoxy-D-manno-octulosonate 8-phosphate phosphatase (KDO 8-P phosphatase)